MCYNIEKLRDNKYIHRKVKVKNMRTEILFPTNEEVTINENATVDINVPSEYTELTVTIDNRVIGFDEAVCAWVELGLNE